MGRGSFLRSRPRARLGDRNRPLLWGDDGRQALAPDRRAPEGKDVRALRSFVLVTRCRTRERRMRGGLHGRREVAGRLEWISAWPILPTRWSRVVKRGLRASAPRSAFLSVREAGAKRGQTSRMTEGSEGCGQVE